MIHNRSRDGRPAVVRRGVRALAWASPVLLLLAGPAAGAGADITGTWAQLDDDTHQDQALIEISNHDGVYVGHIVKYFPDPGESPDPICEACKGAKKGRHIVGLAVIENVRRHGAVFDGGTVTDPDDGSEYDVTLKPSSDGRTLSVTGYLGSPVLGQTRTWYRR